MKIGIVTNLYPPYTRGGAEHVVVRTVEGLIEAGHDVFVVTAKPQKGGDGTNAPQNAMERIYRVHPKNMYFVLDDHKHRWMVRLLWHVRDAFSGSAAKEVSEIMRSERPDVVMTHNLKGIGLRIPRALQALQIPHLHVVHDLQLIYPSGLLFAGKEQTPWHTRPFYFLYRSICRYLLGKPDVVLFPSKYLKDAYQKEGFFTHTQARVLPNPAPVFEEVERVEHASQPLTFLFVGQLEEHKGITFLLEAFKEIPVPARLIVAGEGTCARIVEQAAEREERVTYLGYIAMDQLLNCFGIADALIVPSLCYENSPTVIYESLQAGVPVLAANIGGVGELVRNGKNGFLFEPNNKQDFFRAVQDLAEHRSEFSRARAEIKKSVEPYALSAYIQKLQEYMETYQRS